MSTLKVDNIRHNSATSDAITMASDGTCTAKITGMTGGGALSHRNLIVNGAMNVAQRGQVTGVSDGFGGPDRFRFQSNYSAVTMSQSTDVPSGQGFAKSLKMDVTNAGGDSNADTYTEIDYYFEGQDLTRLKYGSSGAETTILSFWIKSPKAGIHWVRLYGDELSHSGGGNAFISRKYTVSSANTWQKVTLSFPGYTSDGFDNDNTKGMRISWYFAQGSAYSSGTAQADNGGWLNWGSASDRARNTVGQVNCFDSTSNDIFLTGVQFESASTATAFEHRPYADELARCQRYCQVYVNPKLRGVLGSGGSSDFHRMGMTLLNTLRADPTVTWSGTQSVYGGSGTASITGINSLYVDPYSFEIDAAASGSLSGGAGTAIVAYTGGNEATLTLNAEL